MSTLTTLSQLLDFVEEQNAVKYVNLNQLTMDKHGYICLPERKYDLSYVATNGLAKLCGIPAKFFREMPVDLKSAVFNYYAFRKDIELYVSITGDVVSEVRAADSEWTVKQLIDIAADVLGKDAYVIQPYLAPKIMTFYAFEEEERETSIGEVHRGLVFYAMVDKNKLSYVNPIYVDSLSETVCEIDVQAKREEADIDMHDMKACADYAWNEGMSFADRVLANNSNDKIEDQEHFIKVYSHKQGVANGCKSKVLNEILLAYADTAATVAKACMMSEGGVSSFLQYRKIARLAGDAFFAVDPEYCDHCHQELPEDKELETELENV